MPEGDSVRLAVARMQQRTAGATIARSDFRVPQHATADLSGMRLLGWAAYGKHLLARLDAGLTLHTHFEMDGEWTVLGAGKRLPVHLVPDVRVALELADGRSVLGLRLPVLDLLATAEESQVLGHLGPDILADDFEPDGLAEAARRFAAAPARPVVEALLDQRNVAGVGNLWAVETCYLRGLWPWTPVGEADVIGLLALVRRMMRHSVEHRTGQVTTGNRRRGATHWVYGRQGRPCLRCGTTIEKRGAGLAGGSAARASTHDYQRDTWWCPRCQPELRPAGALDPDA